MKRDISINEKSLQFLIERGIYIYPSQQNDSFLTNDFAVSDQAPEDDAPVLDIRVKTTSGNIRLRRAVGV